MVVKEAFVTDSRYKKVTEYYAAYLRGETLGMFILNRLWATLGLLVGLSLVLQGMLPFVLAGVRSCAHTPCSPATLAPNPRPRTSQSTPQP